MPEQDIANNSTIFPDAIKTSKDSFNANGSPLIKVIGVGGGGNNAVNHMFGQNISGVSFVVTNTDRQALVNSPVPTQVLLGPRVSVPDTSPKKQRRQPKRAKPKLPSFLTKTPKWCLSLPVWVVARVRALRRWWRA